ncbi:STAS/SEC14 domain-containing protein [uncultured Cocleimonas sp.]|uniref:STAS/SEC14 domain-containing protein n=1 Tax=uncultured Cocleimonas sp. TaxID=1051587 RepID=UPI0026063E4B|nr:STAS/SEC14 domain-containing protein [uncultured Cocleimonas sp.]
MFSIELDRESAIAVLQLQGELREKDFESIAEVIDPYILEKGKLNGLIINTKDFPGWESFGAMVEHFKFVKDHEKKLTHVALVTDSAIGDLVEIFAKYFVSAKVKHFDYDEFTKAEAWIEETK